MNKRIPRDSLYMNIAELISMRSTCERAQVGCVITLDNRIISTGYNGPPPGFDHCNPDICNTEHQCKRSVHAEANAICFAAKNGLSLKGSIIYCTHMPCDNCGMLLIQSGVTGVIYSQPYGDTYWNRTSKINVERYNERSQI